MGARMGAHEDEDETMAALLRARAAVSPADAAAIAALRAEAPWPTQLGRRLEAEAMLAIAARRWRLADAVLRIRAVGRRIEAFFGPSDVGRMRVAEAGPGELVQAADVRGDAPGGVLVRHALGLGEAATHVDVAGDRFVVMVDLGPDAPGRGVRVSLLRDGRELASEALRKGRWLLPTLPAGAYRLSTRDRDGVVAELDLVLERSAD